MDPIHLRARAPARPRSNGGLARILKDVDIDHKVRAAEGAEGKHDKVINLPGRQANPRRLALWESLSSNKTLFDVCLRASDREVACNSLLLAEESVFFTAKFSNPDFGGSSRLVELQDVDGDTLETVVTALLTASIKLDKDNIERILHCADMLQFSAVKEACCQFMMDCLDEDSAAATLSLAAKFSCDSLHTYTQQYIKSKFHTMRPDALKECSRNVLWELLCSNDLSVYTELQVLTAVTVWCNHNGAEAFEHLVTAVRVENLNPHELHIMAQHAKVLEHAPVSEHVQETLTAHYSPDSPQRGTGQGPRRMRGVVPQRPICSREAAFVRDRQQPWVIGAGRLVARDRARMADRMLAEELRELEQGEAEGVLRGQGPLALPPDEDDDPEGDDAAHIPGRRLVRRRVAFRR